MVWGETSGSGFCKESWGGVKRGRAVWGNVEVRQGWGSVCGVKWYEGQAHGMARDGVG